MDRSIPSFPDAVADDLFLSSAGCQYTYSDLINFKKYFLQQLLDRDVDLNKPIGFLLPSCDELVLAVASCWELGIPFTCLNPDSTAEELRQQLQLLEPSVLIKSRTDSNIEYKRTILLQDIAVDKSPERSWNPPEAVNNYQPEIGPETIFGYFLTSGTTSEPKIVPLKRRQMLFAAEASAQNFRPQPNHFWLLCLPLNHIGGISIILRSILYGSAVYRMESFDKDPVAGFLSEDERFQAASLVPTMLKRLLDMKAFKTHRNFQAILLGGGPADTQLHKEAIEKGIPVVASFGMTETCAQIAANPLLKPSSTYIPVKSVGRVFPPNQVEIRDENGRDVGLNSSGTIWLKGPQVFDCYLDTRRNEQVFDVEGWFNTGDFGHLNMYRHLFIESRRSNLIITGGENVSPHEVEAELRKLDVIKDAAVLGIADKEWGQRVVAVVVPHNGMQIDSSEIRQKLKSSLSSFKIPKQILQVDSLPRNRTGKVIRNDLKKLFKA